MQAMLRALEVRVHNDRAFSLILNNHKISGTPSDFIDPEMEKMFNDMKAVSEAQGRAHEEMMKLQRSAAQSGK